MSVFTEKRTPYEFLVRWGADGQIQGAHIGFLDTVFKNGEVLTQTPSNVESVAMGEQLGFPLASILDQCLIDSLKEIERIKIECNTVLSANQALILELGEVRDELVIIKEQNEDLSLEIVNIKEQIAPPR